MWRRGGVTSQAFSLLHCIWSPATIIALMRHRWHLPILAFVQRVDNPFSVEAQHCKFANIWSAAARDSAMFSNVGVFDSHGIECGSQVPVVLAAAHSHVDPLNIRELSYQRWFISIILDPFLHRVSHLSA